MELKKPDVNCYVNISEAVSNEPQYVELGWWNSPNVWWKTNEHNPFNVKEDGGSSIIVWGGLSPDVSIDNVSHNDANNHDRYCLLIPSLKYLMF